MARRYLTGVFISTWVLWFTAAALQRMSAPPTAVNTLLLAGILMPAVVAFLTVQPGEKDGRGFFAHPLLRALVPDRVSPTLVGFAAAVWIYLAFRMSLSSELLLRDVLLHYVTGFVMLLFSGGAEEFGWRGVLQPASVERFGVVGGTVLTGLVWGIWHAPLWLVEGSFQSGMPFWYVLVAGVALSAVLYLTYRISGSLISAILLHMLYNAFLEVSSVDFWPTPSFIVIMSGGAILALTVLKVRSDTYRKRAASG